MNRKAQSGLEMLGFIVLCIVVSIALAIIVKVVMIMELNLFFLFLGFLFLICGILFGFTGDIDVAMPTLLVSGAASAVFFFLAWFIPKISGVFG